MEESEMEFCDPSQAYFGMSVQERVQSPVTFRTKSIQQQRGEDNKGDVINTVREGPMKGIQLPVIKDTIKEKDKHDLESNA